MKLEENLHPIGNIKCEIKYDSGSLEVIEFPNIVLAKGREALAACLAREIGDNFSFYINRMIFGDGGFAGGSTKYVDSNRNGLFGITQASKPVISSINPNIPTQVIFTSVLANADANGIALNEMALQLATGDLYSMATFPNITKASNMQLTWSWRLSFI